MPFKTLEYLPGINAADCRRLRERGITNTNALLHVATLGIDRRRLSVKAGISPERLLELAHQCALMEISGMERFLPVVRRLGINDLGELKRRDADSLYGDLVQALGVTAAPGRSEVEYWISQARSIDMIEREE